MSNQTYSEDLKTHRLVELESGAIARSLAGMYEPSERRFEIECAR